MADDQTMSLMQCYLASILEANKVTNLTRITDGEQARLLHIEDSLVGLPEVNEAPDWSLWRPWLRRGLPRRPSCACDRKNDPSR